MLNQITTTSHFGGLYSMFVDLSSYSLAKMLYNTPRAVHNTHPRFQTRMRGSRRSYQLVPGSARTTSPAGSPSHVGRPAARFVTVRVRQPPQLVRVRVSGCNPTVTLTRTPDLESGLGYSLSRFRVKLLHDLLRLSDCQCLRWALSVMRQPQAEGRQFAAATCGGSGATCLRRTPVAPAQACRRTSLGARHCQPVICPRCGGSGIAFKSG